MNRELKKLLKNFVNYVEEEIVPTFNEGEGYFYETATNKINIDLTDNEDFGFMRHLKETHKYKNADKISIIVWSILHEIGHYETEDEIEWEDDFNDRAVLALTGENVKYNTKVQDMYFNLPSEFAATEWAIDWVKNNFKIAKEISKLVENLRG